MKRERDGELPPPHHQHGGGAHGHDGQAGPADYPPHHDTGDGGQDCDRMTEAEPHHPAGQPGGVDDGHDR